jgi:hypothetical protein
MFRHENVSRERLVESGSQPDFVGCPTIPKGDTFDRTCLPVRRVGLYVQE